MPHELSETVEMDGKFYNVHGKTKKPLEPKYDFEKYSYSSQGEAVEAAQKRSYLEGQGPILQWLRRNRGT